MRLQQLSSGEVIDLSAATVLEFAGEGKLLALPGQRALAAKVYHQPTEERAAKLKTMLAHPPVDPGREQGLHAIAWPVELLRTTDDSQQIAGYLLPSTAGMHSLSAFYLSDSRRQQWPHFTYEHVLRAAGHLAAAVEAVHARGHVLGDVHDSHVLVSEHGWVTLADTDGFQIRDAAGGAIFRCSEGRPELTPPELQGQVLSEVDQTPEHDRFGLAVLLFQLLMEGVHPYAGVYQGEGRTPPLEARIAAGHFPHAFKRSAPFAPPPGAPAFQALHPTLRDLFMRCFEAGHADPSQRPSAGEWREALQEAQGALATCALDNHHRYSDHLCACPWCHQHAEQGGRSLLLPRAVAEEVAPPAPAVAPPAPAEKPSAPAEKPASLPAIRPEAPPAALLRVRPPVVDKVQAGRSGNRAVWAAGWSAAVALAIACLVPTLQHQLQRSSEPVAPAYAQVPERVVEARPAEAARPAPVAILATAAKPIKAEAAPRKQVARPISRVYHPRSETLTYRLRQRPAPVRLSAYHPTRSVAHSRESARPAAGRRRFAARAAAPRQMAGASVEALPEALAHQEAAVPAPVQESFATALERESARRAQTEAEFQRALEQERARRKQADEEFARALQREKAGRQPDQEGLAHGGGSQ